MSNTIKYDPADFGLPPRFNHWQGDEAEDFVGPFFFSNDNGKITTAFRVQAHNCNGHRTLHGGVMMMFADYTLCIAGIEGGQEGVVTVTCNNEFIAPAKAGDIVFGHGEVMRKGASLIFVRAYLEVAGRTILTSSAVLKRVRRQYAPPVSS